MQYALDVSIVGSYSDPQMLADLAAEAEQAGWDGFFLWDLLLPTPGTTAPVTDPWVALAAIAMATRRMKIGICITALARRRPWKVARETVALDHLSRGRLIVGVGLGFQAQDFATFGEEADARTRAEKLDEGLAVVTGLWSGKPFRFQGTHYQVAEVTFLPPPLQRPRIPVWVAGYWPYHTPLRRAARWDGLLPGKVRDETLTLEEFAAMVAYTRAQRADPDPFAIAIYGRTPANPKDAGELVHPWRTAGATWWREGIEDERGSLEAMRERIHGGPPDAS